MGLMIHGDDELIKHQKGMTYVLRAIIILFIIFLGFITWVPKTKKDVTCSFTRHSIISNKVIAINIPIPPLKCHG